MDWSRKNAELAFDEAIELLRADVSLHDRQSICSNVLYSVDTPGDEESVQWGKILRRECVRGISVTLHEGKTLQRRERVFEIYAGWEDYSRSTRETMCGHVYDVSGFHSMADEISD